MPPNFALTLDQKQKKKILRDGLFADDFPAIECGRCPIDIGKDFGSRPSFRAVVIRGMAALLKAHEGLGDLLQVPDGGVVGILKLPILDVPARIVHAPVFKGSREGWAVTCFLPIGGGRRGEQMKDRIVGG